jgi:hypothetical protein
MERFSDFLLSNPTEETGSSGDAFEMYSETALFDSRHQHRLS